MQKKILSFFNFMNIFENKKNFKRAIVLLFIATVFNLFIRIEAIYNASLGNLMIPIVMPIAKAVIGFITITLSALLIQYTWYQRVNYGFALQFAAMIDVIVSFVSFIMFLFNGTSIDSKLIIISGYVAILFFVSVLSYAIANYTTNREVVIEPELDDTFDDNMGFEQSDGGYLGNKKGIKLTLLGNIFRSFVVIFAKPFIVVGLGMGVISNI
jgi:hypothetical protein